MITAAELLAVAAAFGMTERHASPFGSPHLVEDSDGAELEIIVHSQLIQVSLLFEAAALADSNRRYCQERFRWNKDTLHKALAALKAYRTDLSLEATTLAELETA